MRKSITLAVLLAVFLTVAMPVTAQGVGIGNVGVPRAPAILNPGDWGETTVDVVSDTLGWRKNAQGQWEMARIISPKGSAVTTLSEDFYSNGQWWYKVQILESGYVGFVPRSGILPLNRGPLPTPTSATVETSVKMPSQHSTGAWSSWGDACEPCDLQHPTFPVLTTYVVKYGDTLWSIGQGFGLSVCEMEAANPGVGILQIGDIIIIPDRSVCQGSE